MATVRKNAAIHPLESQFPIVATNLRALVSSWLPPARDPSPEYDDNTLDDEAEGRPERLALGAKPATTQTDPDFQKRMNKKMGILPVNGTPKRESKKHLVNGLVNGSGKRKAEEISDSEEDSKSKLVTKSTSKKVTLTTESTPKKKKSSEAKVHKTISQTITTSVLSTHPEPQSPIAPVTKRLPKFPDTATLKTLELPSVGGSGPELKDPEPYGSQQTSEPNGSQGVSETSGSRTERNRLKKQKKREREKLKKKLAKKESQEM